MAADDSAPDLARRRTVAMLGGALLIAHFGAGPLSLDARRKRLVR